MSQPAQDLDRLAPEDVDPAPPFPYRCKSEYKACWTNREIREGIEQAPVRRVRLALLHAIQTEVLAERVLDFIVDPGLVPEGHRDARHGGLVDLPVVVRWRGVHYIHDGHHRLTACWVLGGHEAQVRLVNFDARAQLRLARQPSMARAMGEEAAPRGSDHDPPDDSASTRPQR